MSHLFYVIAIAPILWEIMNLRAPQRFQNFVEQAQKDSKAKNELTPNQKTFGVLMLGYIFWAFLGLFSTQWVLFAALIVAGFIPNKHYLLRVITSGASLSVLVFIILNKYHFHIDMWQWLLSKLANT